MKWGLEDKVIQQIYDVFKNDPLIIRVNLFGSRAVGKYKSTSDIDLIIMEAKNEFSFDSLLAVRGKINNLPILYHIDLVYIKNISDKALLEEIKTKSVEFYPKLKIST